MSVADVSYDDLPTLAGTGERHAWSLWAADGVGTLNRIDRETVVAAAATVRRGDVFNLDIPLDELAGVWSTRQPPVHHVEVKRIGRDDSLDGFFLQGASQWDGLRHIRFREHGYFGGLEEADLDDSDRLGIGGMAEHGIVTRGVLVDVESCLVAADKDYSPGRRVEIDVEMLMGCLTAQGTVPRRGDVLLIRTGWLRWYRGLTSEQRADYGTIDTFTAAGLSADRSMAAWLWDQGFAAVAADNPALEALPARREVGFLHHRILALLGMPIGELWDLDQLATDCASDGTYEGMLTSSPLYLRRGVGSPANAYLVK